MLGAERWGRHSWMVALGCAPCGCSHMRRWPAPCVCLKAYVRRTGPLKSPTRQRLNFLASFRIWTRHLRSRPSCSQVGRQRVLSRSTRPAPSATATRTSPTAKSGGALSRFSMRLRRQDDANFTNRTRFLARRVEEIGRPVSASQLGVVDHRRGIPRTRWSTPPARPDRQSGGLRPRGLDRAVRARGPGLLRLA